MFGPLAMHLGNPLERTSLCAVYARLIQMARRQNQGPPNSLVASVSRSDHAIFSKLSNPGVSRLPGIGLHRSKPHASAMDNQTDSHTKSFAHVVVFKCPGSGEPLAASFLSHNKNLEEVDSHSFTVRCGCGWSGTMLGISRVNGWVEHWS
jgi:hypothetical protein